MVPLQGGEGPVMMVVMMAGRRRGRKGGLGGGDTAPHP